MIHGTKSVRISDEQVDAEQPSVGRDREDADDSSRLEDEDQHEDELDSIHVDSETDGDDSIQIIQLPITSNENSLSISEHLNSFRDEHYNES